MPASAKWNLAETIYYLCTLEYRPFPSEPPDPDNWLASLLSTYDGKHDHHPMRNVSDAMADLHHATGTGEVVARRTNELTAGIVEELRLLKEFEPYELADLSRCRFLEREVRAIAFRLPYWHPTAEEVLAAFDRSVEDREWLELHQAARLLLQSFPNGRASNAFVSFEGWKFRDHPVWLTAFAGEDGAAQFDEAIEAWRRATRMLVESLQRGELSADSRGKPVPPSAWQDYLIGWWDSDLMPAPVLSMTGFGLEKFELSKQDLGRPNFKHLRISRSALTRAFPQLHGASQEDFSSSSRGAASAELPVKGQPRYSPRSVVVRFAEKLRTTTADIRQEDFLKALSDGGLKTSRDMGRAVHREIFSPKRGRPKGSSPKIRRES